MKVDLLLFQTSGIGVREIELPQGHRDAWLFGIVPEENVQFVVGDVRASKRTAYFSLLVKEYPYPSDMDITTYTGKIYSNGGRGRVELWDVLSLKMG